MDPWQFIIAHLLHRTLFCFTFLLIWREDHDYIDNIAEPASCEPGPSHWPCLHVTGEKLGSSDYWDPEWGVQTVCRPKNVVRHVSVPHPDTASAVMTTDHGRGPVSHSRPLLMWHPSDSSHTWFCIVRYLQNLFSNLKVKLNIPFFWKNVKRFREFFYIIFFFQDKVRICP